MALLACKGNFIVYTSGNKLTVCILENSDKIRKENFFSEQPIKSNAEEDNGDLSRENPKHFLACKFSPSGKYFAICHENKELLVFETVPAWRKFGSWFSVRRCTSLIFTHREDAILVADKTGDIYRFLLKDSNSETSRTLQLGHLSMLLDVVITPDDKFLVSCDRDEKIRVSCYPNSYNIYSFCLGHSEFVTKLNILSRYSSILVSGSGDGTLRFWDYLNGHQQAVIDLHKALDVTDEKVVVKHLICHPEKNIIAATLHSFSVILVFVVQVHLDSKVEILCRGQHQLLKEPWDISFDDEGHLWVLQPEPHHTIQVYHLEVLDSNIMFNEENDAISQKIVCDVNSNWETFTDALTAESTDLSKARYDNVQKYLDQKNERLSKKRHQKGDFQFKQNKVVKL